MTSKRDCLLSVHIKPGARSNEVVRQEEGIWHIRIAAPAIEGKANHALIAYLSEKLDVPKSHITITRGHNSPHKTVAVTGLSVEQAAARLKAGRKF
jgi:hypothetical protein